MPAGSRVSRPPLGVRERDGGVELRVPGRIHGRARAMQTPDRPGRMPAGSRVLHAEFGMLKRGGGVDLRVQERIQARWRGMQAPGPRRGVPGGHRVLHGEFVVRRGRVGGGDLRVQERDHGVRGELHSFRGGTRGSLRPGIRKCDLWSPQCHMRRGTLRDFLRV
ncbi:unnamed protein product [Darwinula stevensoni]|uniref:Uncharacterized protein n=1 Tax=Darwinula stevensoni TaxID=69355 RepID=A0A7R9FT07_9CRUS|nr:unnamed protein product [Darwinula stevensoni]CAG0905018.1 unnamed protein product [Darwinula stevensoni]